MSSLKRRLKSKLVGKGRAGRMQGLPFANPRDSSGYLGLHDHQPLNANTKVIQRHGWHGLRVSRQAQSCAALFTNVKSVPRDAL